MSTSTLSWAPPYDKYYVEQDITINKPFDVVWKQLLKSMSGQFYVINNIEKDSGIINVSFSTNTPENFVDCGTTTIHYRRNGETKDVVFPEAGNKRYIVYDADVDETAKLDGRINILLRNEGPNVTEMTVSAKYVLVVTMNNFSLYSGRRWTERQLYNFSSQTEAVLQGGARVCRPKGVLEKAIFDFVR